MYTVTINFMDKNQPPIKAQVNTRKLADLELLQLFVQFASIKSGYIDDIKESLRHVFNAGGNYIFSVPIQNE